jgi:hypothetical protein
MFNNTVNPTYGKQGLSITEVPVDLFFDDTIFNSHNIQLENTSKPQHTFVITVQNCIIKADLSTLPLHVCINKPLISDIWWKSLNLKQ